MKKLILTIIILSVAGCTDSGVSYEDQKCRDNQTGQYVKCP